MSSSYEVMDHSPEGAGGPAVPTQSRTYQYRKVMKPMLERKRRARINRCLDELKDLMVAALSSEGENVAKLEKADILELTVRHLHRLRREQRLAANPVVDADRFRAGYTHCATEVSRCLAAVPDVDVGLGTKLMTHLARRLNEVDRGVTKPLAVTVEDSGAAPGSPSCISPVSSSYTPPTSPAPVGDTPSGTQTCSGGYYPMPLTPASSCNDQPIDCTTSRDTVIVDHHHRGFGMEVGCAGGPVWRPW